MSDGTKLLLVFLGGAVAGAAGLAALNRNKLDFGQMKPLLTDLMGKVETMKEDIEDMAADARDKVDQARLHANAAAAAPEPEK